MWKLHTHTQGPASEGFVFIKYRHELFYIMYPELIYLDFICESATPKSNIK